MRKKDFDKILNNAKKHHNVTNGTIDEIVSFRKRIFNDINPFELIKNHFFELIDNRSYGYLFAIIKELYEYPEMVPFINTNMYEIIKRAKTYELNNFFVWDKEDGYDFNKYINENFVDLCSIVSSEIIIKLFTLSDLNENNKKIVNEMFKGREKEIVLCLLDGRIDGIKDEEYQQDFIDIVTKVILEVCEETNSNITDIKVEGFGFYSIVFGIKDKIIKVGVSRCVYQIPNDERILQPIIRIDMSNFTSNKGVIEVSEKVDMDFKMSEEELYQLYSEMRDRGIVCADFKKSNIGKLIKDNTIHWNKSINLDNSSRGLIGNVDKVLTSGNYVIIDTDHIYFEKDIKDYNKIFTSALAKRFEMRYRKEKDSELIEQDAIIEKEYHKTR